MSHQAQPDFPALTAAAKALWSSGDFNEIARSLMPVAEDLVRDADPAPGARVLDIGCGSGNVALVAARRYCDVAGIDIAANLIDRARLRAGAEGSEIDFRTGDAQALPFEDESFDLVASVFGIMFAPDQPKAASEALRVCRRGGRIALANWMPEGFGIDFFGAHARHAPPPPDMPSPLVWGTEEGIARLFDQTEGVRHERRTCAVFYRSAAHYIETHAASFGPTIRALERVGPDGAPALLADIAGVIEKYNRATDGTVRMQCDYLLTIATRA
jgi:SAM-dependent methyltransferase